MTMSQDTSLLITTEVSSHAKYYLASVASWIASVAVGTAAGYSSPALPSLAQHNSPITVTVSFIGWFGSLLLLGAFIGSLLAGQLIERFGRKKTLLYTSLPLIFGWLCITYGYCAWLLLIGRFITGIGIGVITLAAPIYIAETAIPQKRGFFGSGFQLFIVTGVLIVYSLGICLNWSWLAVSCIASPILLLIIMMFMPETPTYLFRRKRFLEATESLFFLYGNDPNLVNPNVYTNAEQDQFESKTNLAILKRREILLPLIYCLALMFFQQFSGINAIILYSKTIFEKSHFMSVNLIIVLIAAIQVFFTLIACILVDRCGRRLLLFASGTLMSISMLAMAIYYFLTIDDEPLAKQYSWLPILSVSIFIASFSLGFGPIPWLLMSELIPKKVRGLCSGFCSSFNWLCAFILTKEFFNCITLFGAANVYLAFSIFCLISVIFVWLFIPETKGKSLQEIEQYFIREE